MTAPADHIIAFDSSYPTKRAQCLHCGKLLRMQLPLDADVLIAALQAFQRVHDRCPPPAEPIKADTRRR